MDDILNSRNGQAELTVSQRELQWFVLGSSAWWVKAKDELRSHQEKDLLHVDRIEVPKMDNLEELMTVEPSDRRVVQRGAQNPCTVHDLDQKQEPNGIAMFLILRLRSTGDFSVAVNAIQ